MVWQLYTAPYVATQTPWTSDEVFRRRNRKRLPCLPKFLLVSLSWTSLSQDGQSPRVLLDIYIIYSPWSTTIWCFSFLTGWREQRKKHLSTWVWDGTRWHLSSKETGNLIIDQIWKFWFFSGKPSSSQAADEQQVWLFRQPPPMSHSLLWTKYKNVAAGFGSFVPSVRFKSLNSISERHKHTPEEAQTHAECMQTPNTPNKRIHNYKILEHLLWGF